MEKQFEKEGRRGFRIGAAFLIGSVVLLLVLQSVLGLWSPSGGGSGSFDFYRGPALPLTAISGGEGLEATRHVDFDFSPYGTGEKEVILTDAYTLTNPGSEAVTARLAYPFLGSLIREDRFFPVITTNGNAVDTDLRLSLDDGPARAADWDDFCTAMRETDQLAQALAEHPAMDTPVTVYLISDIRDESTEAVSNKYLTLTYTPDPGTTIWSYHCSDNENEDGTHFITLDVPEHDWQWGFCCLIVQGGQLHDFSQQGHHSTFPPKESNRLDGISTSVARYESTFGEALWALAEHYRTAPMYDDRFENNPHATPETLYRGAMARIGSESYHGFSIVHQILDEVFYSVLSEEVLMYRVFSLTLAPGESVALDIRCHQGASRDLGGFQSASQGYELATRLGSTLSLGAQSASLSEAREIRILEQNFGFDPASGILSVTLDPAVQRYYLRVQAAQ